MRRRELDIVVISDIHLGSYGCHSLEFLQYIKSIQPKILILNGDIIDATHFKNRVFNPDHLEVIEAILKLATEGTRVYYLSGNHDDIIRGYSPIMEGKVILRNHLELVIDQKKYLIFHGDIFDSSVTISPWIARLGLLSYQYLIRLNRCLDQIRIQLGLSRLSLANQVKHRMKKALKYIRDFEEIIGDHANKKEFDVVICGHIHVPAIKKMCEDKITYMNAGDWIENLTSLEYQHQKWTIYQYDAADYPPVSKRLRVAVIPYQKETG